MIDAYKGREGLIAYCTSESNEEETQEKNGKGKNWKQYWTNSTNELYGYKEQYGDTLNNYISMAIYNAKSRTELHAKEMVWLYIDIDCKLKPLTLEESQALTTAILEREDLPEPTLIEFSGHGLQIFYNLKNATNIPLWKLYQNEIVENFKCIIDEIQTHTLTELSNLIESSGIHIDALKDVSRVGRVPDTANVKYKNNTVYSRAIYKSDKVYTLEDLHMYKVFENVPTYEPYNVYNVTNAEIKEMREQAIKSNTKGISQKLRYYLETIIATRIEDLETLIKVRNKNGITDGYRNNLVFIYTATLSSLGYSKKDAWQEIEILNELFIQPLSKKELNNCLNTCYEKKLRAFKNGIKVLERTYYKFTTQTIIEKLDIAESEQEELKILVGQKIRTRRNWSKNGKKYNSKRRKEYTQATESKRKSKEKRNKKVIELSKQGLTQREIALKMSIGLGTVNRILRTCEK